MVPRGYSTCNQNGKLDSGALVKIKRMSTLTDLLLVVFVYNEVPFWKVV